MKDVQQQGGPFEQQSVFIGLPRQITIDTTNNRILLHDGTTPGGRIIASRDEGDTRWMAHIAELEGFASLGAGVKGFAVRKAAGVWAIRAITGVDGIEVTEGFGENGPPVISLADVIDKDLLFNGLVEFTETIQGLGFIGDTQGDHTGNVLGDVTGNVTGDLTGDSAGTHTGPQIGSIDVRGETAQFDADAIPMSAVAGLADAIAGIPSGVPTGFIGMWSGSTGDIPSGWALCDGNNGTPDLRDRFIVGAGPSNLAHSTGGAALRTPAGTIVAGGAHTHTGTNGGTALTIAQMPAHTHPSGVCDNVSNDVFNHGAVAASPTTANSIESNSADGIQEGVSGSTGGGQTHTHTLTIDSGGSHTHAFTGTEADFRPPFYTLAYIMKV